MEVKARAFLSQKLIRKKKKNCFIADGKSHGQGIYNENDPPEIKLVNPTKNWVKKPRRSETI